MIPSSKCRPYTCHSICVTERAVGPLIPAWRHHDCEFIFFALLAQPPISPHNHVSNQHRTLQWPARRSSDRKRARTASGWKNASIVENERGAGSGFSKIWREPPENWVVGCETSRGKGDATHDVRFQSPTINTYALQYLLHFHDEA